MVNVVGLPLDYRILDELHHRRPGSVTGAPLLPSTLESHGTSPCIAGGSGATLSSVSGTPTLALVPPARTPGAPSL